MNPEEEAVYALLAGDGALTALLPQYAGQASIFTRLAPQDAALPYVVLSAVAVAPWDTQTEVGFEPLVDVRCYAERTGSLVALNALAEAAHVALHRRRPQAQATRRFAGVWVVAGPGELPMEEHAVGKVLTVRLLSYRP